VQAKKAPAKKAPAKRAPAMPVTTVPGALPAQSFIVRPSAVPHFTRDERVARGRAERAEVSRRSHAGFDPVGFRRDPVEVLSEQDATRVQDLVPIKYGRMLVSAFTFFRGAAALMAMDLAKTPRTGLHAQLCGDAHLSNFGSFAAPDRRLTFSVNDFDETLPGPFEWDVKRLVTSFAVAGRDLGLSTKQRETANLQAAASYRAAMTEFAGQRSMDLWYSRMDVDEIRTRYAAQATKVELKRYEANVAKARTKDSLRAFDKLTTVVDGERRIVAQPPLIVPVGDIFTPDQADRLADVIRSTIDAYRSTLSPDRRHLLDRFRYVDAARKVVGVGSVGTRAWVVLMVGNDEADPLILQLKEAEASVLEPYVGRSEYAHHGQRVVEGQRLMQSASDIMLGWHQIEGEDGVVRDFYIRQLWDGKGSALVETMGPRALTAYADMCGWTLARAHARSGDAVAIASYLGNSTAFDRAMAAFAESYADQNERDYATLQAAVADGRLEATPGL
jgi:uncharacterized protein (DUF2252 family)